MGILKTTGIPRMLRLFGEKCTAEIDGSPVDFYGIFDEQNILETTEGPSVILQGCVLTVAKSVAQNLPRDTRITIGDVVWQVTEVLRIDDGELARLSIRGDNDPC